MPFHVASGCCAGSYDAVLLSTDLEADDALAIRALAPRLRDVPLLVVVGEGKLDKRQLVTELLATYNIQPIAVLESLRSETDFPQNVLSAYSGGQPHDAPVSAHYPPTTNTEQAVVDFLSQHRAPFALLLKPPHELISAPADVLQRTVAALYGSFNLVVLRTALQKAEFGLTEAASLERQEAWMHSFKTLLWVDRSMSVGRDCTLDPHRCPQVWAALQGDAPLMQHILEWNQSTLIRCSQKLAQFGAAIEASVGHLDEVERVAERAEKNVAIMLSIARTKGLQVCHADTLIAAHLLAGHGEFAKFELRCRAGHDSKLKSTCEQDDSSSVVALIASPSGEARAELAKISFAILTNALNGCLE